MKYRRRRKPAPGLMVVVVGFLILALVLFIIFRSTPGSHVKRTVHNFYTYEQKSDFGSAWELFHPQMQERFSKRNYIQDRNHVFMQHFGVTSFQYTVGKPKSLKSWRMEKDSKALENVYRVPITQTFKSSFGTFTLHQDVFVARERDKYFILWSYQ